jgi:hypothetical protein
MAPSVGSSPFVTLPLCMWCGKSGCITKIILQRMIRDIFSIAEEYPLMDIHVKFNYFEIHLTYKDILMARFDNATTGHYDYPTDTLVSYFSEAMSNADTIYTMGEVLKKLNNLSEYELFVHNIVKVNDLLVTL